MRDGASGRIRGEHGPRYGIGAIIPVMSDHFADGGVTRKEAEVLDAVGERLTNAEIAARMYVSERTVESHVSSLLRKLGAANRRELARVATTRARSPTRSARRLPASLELAIQSRPLTGRSAELESLRDRVA